MFVPLLAVFAWITWWVLVGPAFHTDVTDSYRLGRAGRLRTDLGGLYFNAIVAVLTVGAWWVTRYDAILLLVATQILQMLRQLLDTASYSVAFALVWADGSEPAQNTNEAFAAASCTNCAAVAVAFQIVLVVGDVDVAVPQNLAVAANYECTSCLTYALAVQLFLTVPATLSEDAITSINELWEQIAAYGATITPRRAPARRSRRARRQARRRERPEGRIPG